MVKRILLNVMAVILFVGCTSTTVPTSEIKKINQDNKDIVLYESLPRLLWKQIPHYEYIYIYENENGELAFDKYFDDAEEFSKNGFAAVKINEKWGYININGDLIISPIYDKAWSFSNNGIARVQLKGKQGFINTKGESVIPILFDEAKDFSENGLAPVKLNGKWGYIDNNNRIIIPYQFKTANGFSNGLAVVGKEASFFSGMKTEDVVINENGEIIISDNFSTIRDFSKNGIAYFSKEDGKNEFGKLYKSGYINKKGEVVLSQFKAVGDFSDNGLALVRSVDNEDYYFLINQNGEKIFNIKSLQGIKFTEGQLAVVQIGFRQGYLSTINGKMIIPPQFEYAREFKNGVAAVSDKNSNWNYINLKGEEYSSSAYNALKNSSNGNEFLRLYKSNKYTTASNLIKNDVQITNNINQNSEKKTLISENQDFFKRFKSYSYGKCIKLNYNTENKKISIENYLAECGTPSFYSKSKITYDYIKYTDDFWNPNITNYSNSSLIPYDVDNQSFSVFITNELDFSEFIKATVLSGGLMGVFDIASRLSGGNGMMNSQKVNLTTLSNIHKNLLKNIMSLEKDEFIAKNKKEYLYIAGQQDIFKLGFSELPTFFNKPLYLDYYKYSGFHFNWRLVNNKARFTISSGITDKEIMWDFDLKNNKVSSSEYERSYGIGNRGKFRKDIYEIALTPEIIQTIEQFKQNAKNTSISGNEMFDQLVINTRQFLPNNNKLIYEDEVFLKCLNCDRSNEDSKNSCIAKTKNDVSWCYSIKDEDAKNSCIAETKNDVSWCYSIKDEDTKNSCIAGTKNNVSWCYSIKDEDTKNSCIAGTKNDVSWCYSIKDEDTKNSCIAETKNDVSWCYSIKK